MFSSPPTPKAPIFAKMFFYAAIFQSCCNHRKLPDMAKNVPRRDLNHSERLEVYHFLLANTNGNKLRGGVRGGVREAGVEFGVAD